MGEKSRQTATRRSVLKTGSVAASLGVVGTAVTGGATAAEIDGGITAQGQGEYTVHIAAKDIEMVKGGVEARVTTHDRPYEGFLWVIEGTVNGEMNGTPDDYAFYTVEGYQGYDNYTSDDSVDLDVNIYS